MCKALSKYKTIKNLYCNRSKDVADLIRAMQGDYTSKRRHNSGEDTPNGPTSRQIPARPFLLIGSQMESIGVENEN